MNIDKGIKTRLYTAARYFGEMQDLRRGGLPVVEAFLWQGSYSSNRNSGQIGEVPRFCDSRMARHSEHRQTDPTGIRASRL